MAKLREGATTVGDLTEYLTKVSDFEFEIETLRLIRMHTVHSWHGGSYTDTATSKLREFDLRAIVSDGNGNRYYLAAECKNLRENFPLLISCVPRHGSESFHDVIFFARGATGLAPTVQRRRQSDSRYQTGCAVGKSCAQVGRGLGRDAALVATDSEVFDKWTQALASGRELLLRAASMPTRNAEHGAFVLPLVVVPNGRLWAVEYGDAGEILRGPATRDRVTYFLNHEFAVDFATDNFAFSHLEFVTLNGLEEVITGLKSFEASDIHF